MCLPRSASVLPRTAGTVLDSVAEQSRLGDESVEKAHFVDIAPLNKAEPLMVLLDHTCGQSPSRGTALRLFPPVGRGQSLSAVPASTSGWYYPRALMPWLVCTQDSLGMQRRGGLARSTASLGRESGRSLQALDGRRGQFLQVAAICRHKCTATALSTWGNVDVPRSRPAIEG